MLVRGSSHLSLGSAGTVHFGHPLHFFWSRFFTSSDGNPLIDKEIDSQKKRKRPGKKVKSGGSDPAFSAFSRPKFYGVSRPLRRKRDRVLAACGLERIKFACALCQTQLQKGEPSIYSESTAEAIEECDLAGSN